MLWNISTLPALLISAIFAQTGSHFICLGFHGKLKLEEVNKIKSNQYVFVWPTL